MAQGNGDAARVSGFVHRIVVPVEGSSDELLTHQWAVDLAYALGTSVRAVHVSTGAEDPPDDVFDYMREHSDNHGVELEVEVLHGTDVVKELVDELQATDLVIIGSRRLGTQDQLSSRTQELIRRAPCPVQVIRLK